MFGAGIGLANFLFNILLGAELMQRLRKAGILSASRAFMTKQTSALAFIADQWLTSVQVSKRPFTTAISGETMVPQHVLMPLKNADRMEGLVRFAEAIAWPHLDEARAGIEGMMAQLLDNLRSMNTYQQNWLFGLCLPSKHFRHAIMSSVVLACPSLKSIGAAPYYDSGLVVGNWSYWPVRTVLARALGGLDGAKSTCGWIGPVPAPEQTPLGWKVVAARNVAFTVPVLDDLRETNAELLGFSEADMTSDRPGFVRDLLDVSRWTPPTKLPARPTAIYATSTRLNTVALKAIRLVQIETTTTTATTAGVLKQYRAHLDFTCHDTGRQLSFGLYTNPVFVHCPRCIGVGTHPMHERLVQRHMANVVLAKDLKSPAVRMPPLGTLTIIAATEPGEEVLAKAWCAETGKHAIVRKGGVGCLTCAISLAAKRTGLGFGVLIWCD